MSEVTTVGIHLAKNVFQVHGVDAHGVVMVRKAIRRVQLLRFSKLCRGALSAWRRVRQRTTGRGRLRRWAMKFG
jgi:hypothetical protein